MGQKVNPIVFRLPVRRDWRSRWFSDKKNFAKFLLNDYKIRSFIKSRLRYASIARIDIERSGDKVRVKLSTPRPGVVIGVKGKELDKLTAELRTLAGADVVVDVQEIKRPDLVAQLVAENVAMQLERRVAFRRALKKVVQSAMSFGAIGIRVRCSGRLGGAEIARTEEQKDGCVPLHTLRANVDYGFAEANTAAGKIGIKCWLFRDKDEPRQQKKSEKSKDVEL
ncbi:MAG: 30S ribosomal protein S3 [Puniceicoccales bacterium]|jgi:small subunit ribosomal protein S3|nr:30S ribosomal protein S3 [Puniceicoccales bacterium]